mgnify:CR=1 FL=1
MTDYSRDCLEQMTFPDLNISIYSGLCEHSGQLYNVTRLDMRIDGPVGLAFDERDTIFFGLHEHRKVLQVDLTHNTGSLVCTCSSAPRYMSYDANTGNVLVTTFGGVAVIDSGSRSRNLEVRYGGGNDIGSLKFLRVGMADDIIQLDSNTWLFTDESLNRY